MVETNRIKEIQQELTVSSWDNVLLALYLFIAGILITLVITSLTSSQKSPPLLLIGLFSALFLLFFLQNSTLLLGSILMKRNRFLIKSVFISIITAFCVLMILLMIVPIILTISFPSFYRIYMNTPYLRGIYQAVAPIISIISFFYFHSKIRKAILPNVPTLILKEVLEIKGADQKKLLKKWGISLPKLKELSKNY